MFRTDTHAAAGAMSYTSCFVPGTPVLLCVCGGGGLRERGVVDNDGRILAIVTQI